MRDEWKLFISWIAIVILLLLSGCASVKPNEQWSDESITLATTLTGLSMIDAKQTFMMDEYRSYHDRIEPITYAHEVNPLNTTFHLIKVPTQDDLEYWIQGFQSRKCVGYSEWSDRFQKNIWVSDYEEEKNDKHIK
jgi:hypothetical protein